MKKTYIQPTVAIVKVEITQNLMIQVSGTEQSNEQALSRGFFMSFDDDEVFEGSEE